MDVDASIRVYSEDSRLFVIADYAWLAEAPHHELLYHYARGLLKS